MMKLKEKGGGGEKQTLHVSLRFEDVGVRVFVADGICIFMGMQAWEAGAFLLLSGIGYSPLYCLDE